MYYSVPFQLLRREAQIRAASSAVTVTCDGERVATHARLHGRKGQYSTEPAHVPDVHRDYAGQNGDRLGEWASEKGQATAAVVDAMLRSRTVEQRAYRSCRALLGLGRRPR